MGTMFNLRQSAFSPSKNSRTNSMPRALRLGMVFAFGLAIGVTAVAMALPSELSAQEDAGVRDFVRQERRVTRQASVPAYYPSRILDPLVRQFAPQPSRGRLPSAIVYGPRGSGAAFMSATDLERARFDDSDKPRNGASSAKIVSVAVGTSQKRICVRMCDGYYFPLDNTGDANDRVTQEGLCRSACPDAPVKLFTVAAGAETIEKALSAEMRTYASYPMAFAYTKTRDKSCTCRRDIATDPASLFRDITLRAGDTVVLGEKAKVFQGSSAWPYRSRDFADFQQSKQITKTDRTRIDSMMNVSANQKALKPYTYAARTPPAMREAANASHVSLLQAQPEAVPARRIVEQKPPQQGTILIVGRPAPFRIVERSAASSFILR
jgi:hypothetical protein